MKAEEKKSIYSLLKTISSYAYGYVPKDFLGDVPEFFDDEENLQKIKNQVENSKTFESKNKDEDLKITKGITIDEISEKIARCTRCPLARTRNNVVAGEGVLNPSVFVIGEAPGYDEDIQARPFVGKAGFLLDKMLIAINLDRKKNCFISNIIKCRPPNNRDPLFEECEACISFLEAQIHVLKPKMILCAGRISAQNLLKTNEKITNIHGKFFDYKGIPLMPIFHPSALLRNQELKAPAWKDLQIFRDKLLTLDPDYAK